MADETDTIIEDVATEEVETEALDTGEAEVELDEDGNPVETVVEPEDEEIEFDDLKLRVPKDAAQKVRDALLRDGDYRQKTTALAEERRAVAAERAAVQQATQEELGALANVKALDFQIAEYQKVDWERHFADSPYDAPVDRMRYDELLRSRGQSAAQYAHLKGQRETQAQQETAKRIESGRAVLQKDIEGWSPQLAETLLQTGIKSYGFDRQEIESFEDPRMVKVLHDAHQYQLLKAAQKKVASATKGQEAKPATTLKGNSGKTPVNAATRDFAAFERLATAKT